MQNKLLVVANKNNDKNSIGIKTSFIGIIVNLLIALLEFICGLITSCSSIMFDSCHNILDCISSCIGIISFKISNRKPDNKFVFGYGRFEYIASLFIGLIIIFVGTEFIKSSILKLFSVTLIKFVPIVFVFIIIAFIMKLLLSIYFNIKSKNIDSIVLKAVSIDLRNDLLVILIASLPLILSLFNIFINIDNVCGIIVGIFILISGIKILIQSGELLIGVNVSSDLIENVKCIILQNKHIDNVLELNIYNYGSNTLFGSAKVSSNEELSLDDISKIAYELETEIQDRFNIDMVIRITDKRFAMGI